MPLRKRVLRRYWTGLEPLIADARKLRANPFSDPQLCLNVQLRLIKRISYVEGKIRSWKARCKEAVEQSERDAARHQVGAYQWLRRVFTSVGDAIAFSYINRWDIKPLAYGGQPGFIRGKSGFALELRVLRGVVEELGVPALLSDLTSVLRQGDVFVFLQDRPPLVLEVKSGAKDSRGRRQLRRITRVLDYLNAGVSGDVYHGGPMSEYTAVRALPPRELVTREAVMNGLMRRTDQHGWAVQTAEPGIHYAVYASVTEEGVRALQELTDHPLIFTIGPETFTRSDYPYYPLLLSLARSVDYLNVLSGDRLLVVAVDRPAVEAAMQSRGVAVEFPMGRQEFARLTRIGGSESDGIIVSEEFFARIPLEFMSLEWFADVLADGWRAVEELTPPNGACQPGATDPAREPLDDVEHGDAD